MRYKPETLSSEDDVEAFLAIASLASIKTASPLYVAETAGLRREIVRREGAGLDAKTYRNRLATSEQRLTLYSSEIALASKIGKVPDGGMVILGVVTKNGQPAEGLIVSAYDLDGNPVPPAVETGKDGSFVLTIRKHTDARIVVSTVELEVLRCHDVTFEFEKGRTHRTRIDLQTTKPMPIDPVYPCSKVENGEDDQGVQMLPDVLGQPSQAGVTTVREAGFANLSIAPRDSEKEEGTIIEQIPPGGTMQSPQTHVTLVVAVNQDQPNDPTPPIDPGSGDPVHGNEITMPDLIGANLSEANAILSEAAVTGLKVVFEGRSNTLQMTGQRPRAGVRISGADSVVLIASVPNTWRRDPSLAVSNLYRLHPASADINADTDQEEMIARKLAAMPLEDIEAMLERGEDGVADALTQARRIDRPSLVEAIRFAANAVRENMME
jgi:hypothetical protein